VKARPQCLAHALVIAIARLNLDPLYKSFRSGYLLAEPVSELLKASSVDLTNGCNIPELQQFQAHLPDYKIVVYEGFSPDRLIFSGNSLSDKNDISCMMRTMTAIMT
jgi:hypothetical protein